MAYYLYNGTKLPALPSAAAGKKCFIFKSSTDGKYYLYWWPANAVITRNYSTKKIKVKMTYKNWSYGWWSESDGEWTDYYASVCTGQELEFVNVLNVIWTGANITYFQMSSVWMYGTTPIPVIDISTQALQPASMLRGWFAGRKIAQLRQPQSPP